MICLNRAQVVGHLTQDPDIRQTPSGTSVGDLNIVTKSYFTNLENQSQPSTSFHNVVVWRGLADIVQRFLRKGSQVYLSGRIQTESWEDAQGVKKYKTKIIADDLILLNSKEPLPPLADGSEIGGGLNKAEVLGNMCRDSELRTTPNGSSVCSFGVATNEKWKAQDGSQQERTEFHNIVVWGKLAETVSKEIGKGSKIYVSGRLQTRSWETPDGVKKYTTEIIADEVLSLGRSHPDYGDASMVDTTSAVGSVPTSDAAQPTEKQQTPDIPEINYESEIKPEDLPF